MGKRKKYKSREMTLLLIISVLVLVAVLLSLFFRAAPAQMPTEPPTDAPTEPTAAPTEPPTEPPEFLNTYDTADFTYDGDYLSLIDGDYRLGIDVSIHQGEIDWTQVQEAGMEFVMIRLGYRGYGTGKIMEDANFRTNLEGAKAAGLDVGVYFFSQAVNPAEAREEAEFVLSVLGQTELEMPVVYDWEYIDEEARTAEVDRRTLTDCSLAFLQRIEESDYTPMLYYNTHQVRKLLHLRELEQYDCWLALYSDQMTFPYRIRMWQYTCTGTVPGIEGSCDINLYFPEN